MAPMNTSSWVSLLLPSWVSPGHLSLSTLYLHGDLMVIILSSCSCSDAPHGCLGPQTSVTIYLPLSAVFASSWTIVGPHLERSLSSSSPSTPPAAAPKMLPTSQLPGREPPKSPHPHWESKALRDFKIKYIFPHRCLTLSASPSLSPNTRLLIVHLLDSNLTVQSQSQCPSCRELSKYPFLLRRKVRASYGPSALL